MPSQRKDSQKVEAFTASKDLLRKAQLEAKKRGLTKSGFYRYCLAKELGFEEKTAMQIAEHASVGNFTVIQATEVTQNFTAASAPARKPMGTKRGKNRDK